MTDTRHDFDILWEMLTPEERKEGAWATYHRAQVLEDAIQEHITANECGTAALAAALGEKR